MVEKWKCLDCGQETVAAHGFGECIRFMKLQNDELGKQLSVQLGQIQALELKLERVRADFKELEDDANAKEKESNRLYSALREAALNLSIADQRYRSHGNERMELVDAWAKLNQALRGDSQESEKRVEPVQNVPRCPCPECGAVTGQETGRCTRCGYVYRG